MRLTYDLVLVAFHLVELLAFQLLLPLLGLQLDVLLSRVTEFGDLLLDRLECLLFVLLLLPLVRVVWLRTSEG